MQIYFVKSASNIDEKLSLKIINILNEKGNTVWFSNSIEGKEYFSSMITKIKNADAVFVEISEPDADIGYQVAYSLSINLPVFAFHKLNAKISPIFDDSEGKKRSNLHLVPYKIEELEKVVEKVLVEISDSNMDSITIPLSPLIKKYLVWASKKHNVSQSTFIRSLIEGKMLKDRDYRKEYL
jgi:hypothetical protein